MSETEVCSNDGSTPLPGPRVRTQVWDHAGPIPGEHRGRIPRREQPLHRAPRGHISRIGPGAVCARGRRCVALFENDPDAVAVGILDIEDRAVCAVGDGFLDLGDLLA